MPEELTPEFWVNLFATIFFAATVGLMLWDIHNQKKVHRDDTYEVLRDDHAEIVKLQLENSDLDEIWKKVDQPTNVDETKWTEETKETKERKIFLFYVLIFDLYERLHWELIQKEILDATKQRKKEWGYWLEWLKRISKHWLFEYTFDSVFPVYDEDFVTNIAEEFFPQKVEKLNEYWDVKEKEEKEKQRKEELKPYQYNEAEKITRRN